MKYEEINNLVDIIMDDPGRIEEVLLTLNDESDLWWLLREIDDMILEASIQDIPNLKDRAINIRENIEIELNGRSLEEYYEQYYEQYDETIEEILNSSDDEYREKWLEDFLNDKIKWLKDVINARKDRFDIESETKDLILLKEILEEKSNNNRPINENPRSMFLILEKYYGGIDGILFAISDSLRNNPDFMARMINDYFCYEVLDLYFANDETWAEVARMSNDDKLKSKLLHNRLMEQLKYEILEYYSENIERYHLEETLKYRGYLELEDIPNSDCNDVTLLEYVIKQKGERGEPIIPAKELSKYYGLVAQRDDNLKSITLRAMEEQTMEMSDLVGQKARKTLNEEKSIKQEEISPELEAWMNGEQTPLQKKEKELSALEKEEKTITEAEALIEKQNEKDVQDIGE